MTLQSAAQVASICKVIIHCDTMLLHLPLVLQADCHEHKCFVQLHCHHKDSLCLCSLWCPVRGIPQSTLASTLNQCCLGMTNICAQSVVSFETACVHDDYTLIRTDSLYAICCGDKVKESQHVCCQSLQTPSITVSFVCTNCLVVTTCHLLLAAPLAPLLECTDIHRRQGVQQL